MKGQFKNKIVYVAMSGGVDSSVVAALLKKRGFKVVGVFMKPWSPQTTNDQQLITNDKKKSPVVSHQSLVACMWKQDREDALRAATVLDIPLLTWDFSKEYKKEVTDYMIREYRTGRTPNPDVMCNKKIKFGLFLKKALKEGADYIATGHYVRIRPTTDDQRPMTGKREFKKLLIGIDKNKDQSYFLWTLKQEQLKYCLFPIGDYIKPEVRKLAKKFGLPNHDKKDSQGVCFIGPLDMKDFLKKYIKPKRGKIIDAKGKRVGWHDGVYYYTIGQRHGLDIKNGQGPYYVTGKDMNKNLIYVGEEQKLGGREAMVSDISWVSRELKLPAEIDVKIRYRTKPKRAVLNRNGNLRFKNLIRAITPGQSAVFYKEEELLGGGIIK